MSAPIGRASIDDVSDAAGVARSERGRPARPVSDRAHCRSWRPLRPPDASGRAGRPRSDRAAQRRSERRAFANGAISTLFATKVLGPLSLLLLAAVALSACSGQSLVDAALAAPSGTPPPSEFGVVLNTPAPTPTAVVIVPRRLTVNVARLSVKPGDPQEIDVNGTPNAFINIIVSLANGDRFNDASHLGAQLDINGTYADKWTIDQLAPGGSVSVQVQDVATGQIDHESFLIDAKPWGGPAPADNPPIVAFVPYGTPGAAPVAVTPSPSTVPVPTPPFDLATVQPDGTVSGNLQVQSSPSPASIANGGTIRINGYLTDSNGKGVSGARLFAIAHFPGGHSEVWVSPAESGSNGLVWVSAPVTGVSSSATILVDVYMTYNGQSYHGQTSFQVR